MEGVMILATNQDTWTGTRGRQAHVIRVSTPEEQLEMEIRVAVAAVASVMEKVGSEAALKLTLSDILERYL
jgi:hypothetical protein